MPCVTTRLLSLTLALLLLGLAAEPAHASGTLTPLGSTAEPIRILDHHVDVVIQNGYVRVEVTRRSTASPSSASLPYRSISTTSSSWRARPCRCRCSVPASSARRS